MDIKKVLGNVPWITKDGNFDLTGVPHRQHSETSTFRG